MSTSEPFIDTISSDEIDRCRIYLLGCMSCLPALVLFVLEFGPLWSTAY
jgi:hypothetical protein